MNPLYMAVVATVVGKSRRCPACQHVQVIDRVDDDGRYHCKQCGHRFTKQELRRPPHSR